MLLTDLEAAKRFGSSFFTEVGESLAKRRVRALMNKANIAPVEQREDVWLYHEADITKVSVTRCPLKFQNEKVPRITRLRVQSRDMAAYEKARELIARGKRRK